jgi:hypothetical protein
MESRVLEFLENWVAQNVRATGNATDKTVEVERLIELFKQHARMAGIRDADIQQATAHTDLAEYMRRAAEPTKS